jgi:lysophospholipase L1-like esterase
LILSDSVPKYTKAKDTLTSFHKGNTIGQLNDLVCFNQVVQLSKYGIILIHAGTNDLAQLIKSGKIASTTVQQLLQFYIELCNSIRRRNTRAILVFSAILPRAHEFQVFFPYIFGLNFALEKWCAKSSGMCVFLNTHKQFLQLGVPKFQLFSKSDGLHPNGAGNDRLEARLQQALTADNIINAINSKRTRRLAVLPF